MEISRAQLKFNAKQILANKSILIIISLIYSIASVAAGFVGGFLSLIPFVGPIILIGIMLTIVVFSFQITKANMDATNDTEIDVFNFSKLKKAIFVSLWSFVYMLPGFVAYMIGFVLTFLNAFMQLKNTIESTSSSMSSFSIIPTIIMFAGMIYLFYISYSIFFAVHMVYDGNNYDNMTAHEIIKTCIQMMKGYKFKLFILGLSFIGWYLVVGLIGMIPLLGWILSPVATAILTVYIALTQIQFYKAIAPQPQIVDNFDTLNMYKE